MTTSSRVSRRNALSTRKPASFWREKRGCHRRFSTRFAKILSCQVKNTIEVLAFFEQQKGSVTSKKNG